MEGVKINNAGAEIYYTRHAEQHRILDSPLSDNGIEQAKRLSGHFDCVIVSPLRRTKETLHYSQICWNHLQVNSNLRERIFGPNDCFPLEKREPETDAEFFSRMHAFHQELETLCQTYKKILIVGHAYFFNAWYRQGCYPTLAHATIMRLI